jgi:hypothetical protein
MSRSASIFRFVLVAVIVIESLMTVIHSLHSETQSHLGTILPWFASVEALAAFMLLFRPAAKAAGSLLLLIFLIAIAVHGPVEQMQLFVYAAGVWLVMTDARVNKRPDKGE